MTATTTAPPSIDRERYDVIDRVIDRDRVAEVKKQQAESGWSCAFETVHGEEPTRWRAIVFTRPRFRLGEQVVWSMPNQQAPGEPPVLVPCFVLGQHSDGPYQLFVLTEHGFMAHAVPTDQLALGPLGHQESLSGALAREVHRLSERLDALEEVVTAKGKRS